uniref:TMV resistance protein N n=1 Tax=Vitis vinifera TaxID=29760 RepID=F6H8X9_VITVI
MGLAVCVVFHANIGMGKFGRSAYFSMNESGGFSLHNTVSMHFSKADHIWFGYRPLFGDVFSSSIDHLKVSFAGSNRAGEVVKKCGVRLVFEQDEPCGREEEMNHVLEGEGDYKWMGTFATPRFSAFTPSPSPLSHFMKKWFLSALDIGSSVTENKTRILV